MKEYLGYILKGIAMGTANVIPGVSGGTMALITGIFERLIHSIKSFNSKAIKYLLQGRLKDFAAHTDLLFLIAVFAGIGIAIVSLARLFDFLFTHYPVYIWAFFFGLVLASVYFVGKTVGRWTTSVIISFIAGAAGAIIISVLNPATENSNVFYLMICGVVAMCSMILPGLSGSFVLFIMGNYKLVMIDAVNNLDLDILIPVALGAAGGLLAFSHFLSWILKKYKDQTISLLTGFILGSLSIIWPWQKKVFLLDGLGNQILKKGEPVIVAYRRYWPESFDTETLIALLIIILGIVSIWAVEKAAEKKA
jgi:putative membrane protein